ncbi:phage major capsid protein [Trichormus sp. NMC-1]|uniref:phage major capsid protein n=1 Tax=Trichormus sp. NMC-1 TaxID=1853259 RepID=UPI0008DC18AB|nr:phage major capsid protein [Trichormus sp. NMC-1]
MKTTAPLPNPYKAQRQEFISKEFSPNPLPTLGLSRKEQKQYSLRKAILGAATKNFNDCGFEVELSNELCKQSNRSTNGLLVPMTDLLIPDSQTRATYAVGASATGGATVETITSSDYITFLRNRALIMLMGARMLADLRGDLDIPRQSGVSSVYWLPSEGANVAQSESTFDKVSLKPKTVGAKSRYTRNFLLQSSLDAEAFIREDLAAGVALGIDQAAISGTGASGEPLGILNYPGVSVVSLGTNGAVPTWAKIVEMESAISGNNADVGTLGYLTNSKVRGKLKTTIKNPAGTDSSWIWESSNNDDAIGNGELNGYRAGVSNQIPSDLTKGTGTNLSAIIFGNFADLLIGMWGELELLANPYGAGFDNGDVEVRALQSVDIAPRHENSFAVVLDCITS